MLAVGVGNYKLREREGLPEKVSFLHIAEGGEGTGH